MDAHGGAVAPAEPTIDFDAAFLNSNLMLRSLTFSSRGNGIEMHWENQRAPLMDVFDSLRRRSE